MNLSSLSEEETLTPTTGRRERETELVNLVDAIRNVLMTPEWSSLKEKLFDGLVERLERQLITAATRKVVDEKEIYHIQGQLVWAKRFSDLEKLADMYRLELTSVRRQLNPPTEREMAPDTL